MSSKEAEREEMKEETHDVEDMEQDELDEEERILKMKYHELMNVCVW